MTFTNELKPSLEEALEHYGVKGMKWGVRRTPEQLGRARANRTAKLTPEQKQKVKKVAIITGGILLTAGAAYAGYNLSTQGSRALSSAVESSTAKTGKVAAEKVLSEPTSVIYSSRGKNKGFRFLEDGGTKTVLSEWEKAFGADGGEAGSHGDFFKKYEGKIAAQFMDPKGRRDAAGRLIPHSIILPPTMTEGVNSIEDVKTKVWPTLEKTYDAFWEESTK